MVNTLIGIGTAAASIGIVAWLFYKQGYNTGYRHGRAEGELNMLGRILNQIRR